MFDFWVPSGDKKILAKTEQLPKVNKEDGAKVFNQYAPIEEDDDDMELGVVFVGQADLI